ncbi:flagellar filament capping protein FliD [Fulvimonas yonginensis]|uniref:Flagellar hook-associated protein 2 n=1 Tax=Fulvimonas yonginensis TaxID=1495200 RepID=A0ABU8J9L9_9GAMM
MAMTVNSSGSSAGALFSAAGIGSGIDVTSLVTQLVAARKAPLQNQIDSQTSKTQMQISALGQVSAALAALQSALGPLKDGSALNAHGVAVGDDTILTASSHDGAVNGSYQVAVTQLAKAMKASSGAFTDSNAAVGTGTLTITVDGQAVNLDIDSAHASLGAIRDAINGATDNPGVSAAIVTGTDGAHLVLRSTRTGAANGFSVSSSGGDGGLAALAYDPAASSGNGLTVVDAAQDAQFTIDGLAGSSAGNTVSTAIDGLTLNLAAPGSTSVTVSSDTAKATSAVTNLVNTYNSFIGIYKNLTRYDAASGSAGALIGDATLNSIKGTLAAVFGGAANGSSLSAIGVTLQLDGTLKVDSGDLSSALSNGGGSVKALFGGSDGFAAKLDSALDNWIGDSGILETRTDNLNDQLSSLSDRQSELDSRMAALTTRYTRQFSALDTLLTKLNSTSSYLTQQFDALTAANKNK